MNSIGDQQFVTLSNASGRRNGPELLRELNEIIQRDGIDGTVVRRLGKKSPPFQMISGRDTISLQAAANLLRDYSRLTAEPPQEIVWNDISYTAFGVEFVVFDVAPLEMFALRNVAGGLEGSRSTGARLTAIWTLQPVAVGA